MSVGGADGAGPGSGAGVSSDPYGGYGGPAGPSGPTASAAGDIGGVSGVTGGFAGPGGVSGGFANANPGLGISANEPGIGGYGGGFSTGDYGGYGGGSAVASTKGDFGGPSIGFAGGPPSASGLNTAMDAVGGNPAASTALAQLANIIDMINSMNSPGSTRAKDPGSTHAMNSSSIQGFGPGTSTSQSGIGGGFNTPGTANQIGKSDFGDMRGIANRGARGRAIRAARNDPRPDRDMPSGVRGGVPSDINTRAGLNSPDYMAALPAATQVALRGVPPSPDPGPRGLPAPARRSSPTPAPVEGRPFNVQQDFGPMMDTMVDAWGRAQDFFGDEAARRGFQQSRVGGVGGGGTGLLDHMQSRPRWQPWGK